MQADGLVYLGGAVQLDRDHGCGAIGRSGRELEFGPRTDFFQGDGKQFSAGDKAGGGDFGLKSGEHEAAVFRPIEDDEVERVAARRDIAPRLGVVPRRGTGGVDDLRVALEPLAGLEEILGRLRRNAAGAIGADVEQVGAAATDRRNETVKDLFSVLPILIIPRVGPRIVGGIAGLPQTLHAAGRNFHVALAEVVTEAVTDATAKQRAGLCLADERSEFFRVLFGHIVGGVEPHVVQRAIVRADFLHLRVTFFAEVLVERGGRAVGVLPGAVVSSGGGPVLVVRVIETETEAGLAGRFCEFLHGIAGKRRGVDDIERVGGFEHREAVVVL